jgi:hypothetical protein
MRVRLGARRRCLERTDHVAQRGRLLSLVRSCARARSTRSLGDAMSRSAAMSETMRDANDAETHGLHDIVVELREVVAARDAMLAERDAMLAARDAEIASKAAEVDRLRAAYVELMQQMALLQRRIFLSAVTRIDGPSITIVDGSVRRKGIAPVRRSSRRRSVRDDGRQNMSSWPPSSGGGCPEPASTTASA